MKNLDIKNIMLILLLILSLFLGYKWYFKDNNNSRIFELNDKYNKLKHDRDSINFILKDIKTKYIVLDKADSDNQKHIKELEGMLSKMVDIANISQANLESQRLHMLEIRRKIATFDTNYKKSDSVLIGSIKNKTK